MKLFHSFLLFLNCFIFQLQGAGFDKEPIIVQLATETQLLPIHISPIIDDHSGLDASYIKKLEAILKFDLHHNGMTYVVSPTKESERIDIKTSYDHPGDLTSWMDQNIYYVIKPRISEKSLGARLLIINNNSIKTIDGLQLTGNLDKDRRQIHALSDSIHRTLFDSDGIASTRMLYTIKFQDPRSKEWTSEVFESDYDGANVRQVTQDKAFCVTPCYIPPRPGYISKSFAYVSYKNGQPKIYFCSMEDGKSKRFSLLRGNQLMPSISAQRDKIAFISDVTGNPDLFMQYLDPEKGPIGKPSQIFATHLATQGTPTFSPDGSQIAFVSNKDGSPRIYLMTIPAPGTSLKNIHATLLTRQNRENTAPCWSPDGKKIAYCAMTKGVRQIWIYDFEKRQEKQLTQGYGNKENPSFAPNSLHLVFNSTDQNGSELYLINLNQKEAVKISSGPGEKRFPSWEPRP